MIKIRGVKYKKLNLGCSDKQHLKFPKPWLNVDIKPGVADYVCDVRVLPSGWTEAFKEVRASHILEHLYLEEQLNALNEWVRVLEAEGTIRIIVPDLDIVIDYLQRGYDKKGRKAISGLKATSVMAQIYGLGYEGENTEERWRHRTIFNKQSLVELLESQRELGNIRVYSNEKDPASVLGIKDDSQNQFSLCVKARKIYC